MRKWISLRWKTILISLVVVNLIGLSQILNPISYVSTPVPSTSRKLSQDFNGAPVVALQAEPVTPIAVRPTTLQSESDSGSTTITTMPSMSERNFSNLMERRISRIRRQCRLTSATKGGAMWNNVLMLPDKDFVYCPVFKAGTSLWLEKFIQLSGKSLDKRFDNKGKLERARVGLSSHNIC